MKKIKFALVGLVKAAALAQNARDEQAVAWFAAQTPVRVAVLGEDGIYLLGHCPRCVAKPSGYCAGCSAEIEDGQKVA